MQMNAEFKEEQIGPPFVWVGALEGGGGGKRGSNPKNTRDVQTFFFFTLLVNVHFFFAPPAEVLHLCIKSIG